MKEKQATIRISRVIKVLGHPCKACEWNHPPIVFEGKVTLGYVEWPIFGKYHISHCPYCGGKLPLSWPSKANSDVKEG